MFSLSTALDAGAALLTPLLFPFAVIAGIVFCVVGMHVTMCEENRVATTAYRAGYALTGLALAWSFGYGHAHGWDPWPPHLALVAALDYLLALRLYRYWKSPGSHPKNSSVRHVSR